MERIFKLEHNQALIIKHVHIYTENDVIKNGTLRIENGKISQILQSEQSMATYPSFFKVINGQGLYAIPGFIDGHIHGANGRDVMDATEEAIDTIAKTLPAEGTTSFLATTITQSKENISRALENIAHYPNKQGYAEVLGVHLEGPFIEKSKKGAQPLEHIMNPNIEQFDQWQQQSGGKIKTITMAPELDQDGSFISHVANQGVNVSAGHTKATFHDMKKAVKYGVRQVTHICNAMSGIHHRDIGVVGAALLLNDLRAELIADRIHVSDEMMQLIYDQMGSERLMLITDAMRAKCLPPGDYELGGQPVKVTNDRAVLHDDTLAGSILKMYNAAQNMLKLDRVTLRHIIEMASVNPAKQLSVFDRKGSLTTGKDADILLVNDMLDISYTICRGVIAYERDGK